MIKKVVISFLIFCGFFNIVALNLDDGFLSRYEFRVSNFEYDDRSVENKQDKVQENVKSTEYSKQPDVNGVVINTENIYIEQKNNTPNNESEKTKEPFKIKTGFYYPFILDTQWRDVVTPIITVRTGFAFPEIKKGMFSFGIETDIDFKAGIGKGENSLNYFSLSFSLPLVFSFYLKDIHKISFAFSPYYELVLLRFRELYRPTSLYTQNQFGLAPAVRYTVNLSSFLDFGVEVKGDIALTQGAFKGISAGFILDWRV